MTRRVRRRLGVVVASAVVGMAAPVWGPPLLSRLPAFSVEHVSVVGTRHIEPAEVLRLMDLPSAASVWDDPAMWEERIRTHELVREARVHRVGLHALEVQVTEVVPVAFVPAATLVPVDAEGRVVALDPAEAGLDLPIIAETPDLIGGRVTGEATRTLIGLLVELRAAAPRFVRRVSELHLAPGGAAELRLVEGSRVQRILLSLETPIRGLRRAERALRAVRSGAEIGTADARFRGQVVLGEAEGS